MRHKRSLTVVGCIATAIHPRDDTARPTKNPIFLLSDCRFRFDPFSITRASRPPFRIHTHINIIMSVRLIITMCHRGRVNFGRVVNDRRRRRPEMEKYNICCCVRRGRFFTNHAAPQQVLYVRSISL